VCLSNVGAPTLFLGGGLGTKLRNHDVDYRAKSSYDVTTQSVTISTIHNVKGFDYACVFVIGLDWLEGTRCTEEQIRNLTYVAITRARARLYVPFIETININ